MAARGVSTTRQFSSLGTEPRSCVRWRTSAQSSREPRLYRGTGQVPLALSSTRRAAPPDSYCPSRHRSKRLRPFLYRRRDRAAAGVPGSRPHSFRTPMRKRLMIHEPDTGPAPKPAATGASWGKEWLRT